MSDPSPPSEPPPPSTPTDPQPSSSSPPPHPPSTRANNDADDGADRLPWYRRSHGPIVVALLLVLIAMVAAVLVVLLGQNQNNGGGVGGGNDGAQSGSSNAALDAAPAGLTTTPTFRPANANAPSDLLSLDDETTSPPSTVSSKEPTAGDVATDDAPEPSAPEQPPPPSGTLGPTPGATGEPTEPTTGDDENDDGTTPPPEDPRPPPQTPATSRPTAAKTSSSNATQTDDDGIPQEEEEEEEEEEENPTIPASPIYGLESSPSGSPALTSTPASSTAPSMPASSTAPSMPASSTAPSMPASSTAPSMPASSTAPSKPASSTSPPSSTRFAEVLARLEPLSGSVSLGTPGSPQRLAAAWMADGDPIPREATTKTTTKNSNARTIATGLDLDDPRFEQRYVMALFYFATDGDNWERNAGWLGPRSECEWQGVAGDSDGCPGGCVRGRDDDLGGEYYDRVCRMGMGRGNNLYGELPSELGILEEMRWFEIQQSYVIGTIPESIGRKWTKLHTLLLGYNNMHGGFPDAFANSEMLGTVFVDHNGFNGTFPSVFGTLKNLEWLDAENNGFEGGLPASIGDLKSLRIFNVNGNNMTGPLPDTWDEDNLIEDFEVAGNDFDGPLPPSLGRAAFLKDLRASRNRITGTIPAEYHGLERLEELYLDENDMFGELPPGAEPLYDGLQEFSVHSNGFSGRFPVEHFEDTFRLKVLSLHNNQLTGVITENICARVDPSLSYTRLIELTVDCNLIECECCTCYDSGLLDSTYSPPIPTPDSVTSTATNSPTSFGNGLTNQEQYVGRPTRAPNSPMPDRNGSAIRDQIQSDVLQRSASFDDMNESDPRHLAMEWILQIDRRRLTADDVNLYQRYVLALLAFSLDSLAWYACGEHRTFGNRTELYASEDCELQNSATGRFEGHKVWLSGVEECEWYGVICSSDGFVRGLELIGNDLIGQIPPEISQLRSIQYLALNGNCLYGTIPPEFGTMPNLLSLELHGNGLSGELPVELYNVSTLQLLNVAMQYQFANVCYMSDGTVVNTLFQQGGATDVSYNLGLMGNVLDSNAANWVDMKGLHLFDNSFTGSIAEEIGELKDLVFLRAQNNMVSSYLPDRLGDLKKLREVYLFKNEIYFDIPISIGGMGDLEDLRLHENEMSGPIPDSFYNLIKLKKVWLQDTIFCEEVWGGSLECAATSDYGFTGTISTQIGNLNKLEQLLISNNPFEGTVPTEIGLCDDLALLHMHKTNIVGSAPLELCSLRDKSLNNEVNQGVFYADCSPNNKIQDPFFFCNCCSDCCDHTTKVCIADD